MTNYYQGTAYNSTAIPNQPPAPKRSWLHKFGQAALPWGNTGEAVPKILFEESNPSHVKQNEQKLQDYLLQKAKGESTRKYIIDRDNRVDAQCISYAKPALRTFLITILYYVSMSGVIFGVLCTLICPILLYMFGNVKLTSDLFYNFFLIFPLPAGIILFFTYAIMMWLPIRVYYGIGKGPTWQFNRQTGLVTLFKRGKPRFSAPFYEWDARIRINPSTAGTMMLKFYLIHRYQKKILDFGAFTPVGVDEAELFALWDFIQNYMDTSQPLPDIPLLESTRDQDPVSAAYDQQTERSPTYWHDIGEASWQAACSQMSLRRYCLNPLDRADIMLNSIGK